MVFNKLWEFTTKLMKMFLKFLEDFKNIVPHSSILWSYLAHILASVLKSFPNKIDRKKVLSPQKFPEKLIEIDGNT